MSGWRRPTLGILAAIFAAGAAESAEEPGPPQTLQIEVPGSGVVTAEGRQSPIKSVTYATFVEPRRTSYSASLDQQTLTFTGEQDGWTDKTHYTLTLDAVLSLSAKGVKDMPATGTCHMEISPEATVIRLVLCEASTESGPFSLRFQLGG